MDLLPTRNARIPTVQALEPRSSWIARSSPTAGARARRARRDSRQLKWGRHSTPPSPWSCSGQYFLRATGNILASSLIMRVSQRRLQTGSSECPTHRTHPPRPSARPHAYSGPISPHAPSRARAGGQLSPRLLENLAEQLRADVKAARALEAAGEPRARTVGPQQRPLRMRAPCGGRRLSHAGGLLASRVGAAFEHRGGVGGFISTISVHRENVMNRSG